MLMLMLILMLMLMLMLLLLLGCYECCKKRMGSNLQSNTPKAATHLPWAATYIGRTSHFCKVQ